MIGQHVVLKVFKCWWPAIDDALLVWQVELHDFLKVERVSSREEYILLLGICLFGLIFLLLVTFTGITNFVVVNIFIVIVFFVTGFPFVFAEIFILHLFILVDCDLNIGVGSLDQAIGANNLFVDDS